PLEKIRDPLFGEDAHEIIFERKIKARGAGIALASGAPAKLVIDTPRLVPLGAENVQASCGDHFVMIRLDVLLKAKQALFPLLRVNFVFGALVIEPREVRRSGN